MTGKVAVVRVGGEKERLRLNIPHDATARLDLEPGDYVIVKDSYDGQIKTLVLKKATL